MSPSFVTDNSFYEVTSDNIGYNFKNCNEINYTIAFAPSFFFREIKELLYKEKELYVAANDQFSLRTQVDHKTGKTISQIIKLFFEERPDFVLIMNNYDKDGYGQKRSKKFEYWFKNHFDQDLYEYYSFEYKSKFTSILVLSTHPCVEKIDNYLTELLA